MRTLRVCLLGTAALLPARPSSGPPALPVAFEPNRGQAARGVRFLGHARQGLLLLTERGAVLRMEDGSQLSLAPEGGNARPRLIAEEPVAGVSHYLRGNDRSRWITGVPHFRRVRYLDIYPGIDLVFHGDGSALEYDLVVAPGADPRVIRMRFRGARRAALNAAGDLEIEIGQTRVELRRPTVCQEVRGSRREIPGRFVIAGRQVRFAVGRYDRARPLVIDPVLRYGTYLGGQSRDIAGGIAVDAGGSAYLVGSTVSADFPVTSNALQIKHGGIPDSGVTFVGAGNVFDVFVSKFSPDGSGLVYSTFLGGAGDDQGKAIAVDGAGNAVIAGSTASANFPLASGTIQKTLPPGASTAGFVTKLNANGSDLLYSTYLGGAGGIASVYAVALDAAGNPYATGWTSSPAFPVSGGAWQPALAGGFDGFVVKLNPQGTAVVYSTFLGGKGNDSPRAIAVDPAGNAYLAGSTTSPDFPTTAGAAQATPHGPSAGFVVKLNAAGTALVYSTFVGGSDADSANAIALDRDNSALVTGTTQATNFPTTLGAFQQTLPANQPHAFVMKLDPTGAVHYATLLGGSGSDSGAAIAVAADGSALVAGATTSTDFPLTDDAYQRRLDGANCVTTMSPFPPPPSTVPCLEAFLTILHVSGRRLVYSTYLGGSDNDTVSGLALGAGGSIYLAGSTGSNDFPTTPGAYRRARAGGTCTLTNSPTFSTSFACEDAFVLKIDPNAVGPPRPVAAVVNAVSGVAGPVAPGEFVSLYGIGIGPRTPDTGRLGPDGRALTTLSGTTVTFNGAAAPLLYVGPNQINAIVPFEVAAQSSVTIGIATPDYSAVVAALPTARTAPGLVSLSGTGQGQAAALNQDGTVNGAGNPAAPGSVIVLYGTGAGQTSPAGVDGRLALVDPLSIVAARVSVTIGGVDAPVLYAGAAPGLVEGAVQINAIVPAGVTPGAQIPVWFTAEGMRSQTGIWVAVQ